MIDFYFWTTPNGHKITMLLEETGLAYTFKPINISKGEQFTSAFLAIAPNNRIPAIVDNAPAGGGKPLSIFESRGGYCWSAGPLVVRCTEGTWGESRMSSIARVQWHSQSSCR